MLTPEKTMERIYKRLLPFKGKQFTNTLLAQVRSQAQAMLTYLHDNDEVEPPSKRPFHAKPRASVRKTATDSIALELYWSTDLEEEMREKAGVILSAHLASFRTGCVLKTEVLLNLVRVVNAEMGALEGADQLSQFFLTYDTNLASQGDLKFFIVVEE